MDKQENADIYNFLKQNNDENISINQILEETKINSLKEASLSIGGEHGLSISTQFAKWAAVQAVTGTVCATALSIAGMFAPPAAAIMMMIPSLLSIVLGSPIAVGLITMISLRFAPGRWVIKKILGLIGGKTLRKAMKEMTKTIEQIKQATKMTDEQTKKLISFLIKNLWKEKEIVNKITEIAKLSKEKISDEEKKSRLAAKLKEASELIKRTINQKYLQKPEENPEENPEEKPEENPEEKPEVQNNSMGQIMESWRTFSKNV